MPYSNGIGFIEINCFPYIVIEIKNFWDAKNL